MLCSVFFRFIGCIKDLKYAEGYKELIMQPLEEKGINTLYGCYNYCDRDSTEPRCNSGTCLNRFTHYECDCFGTGYEGKYCEESMWQSSNHASICYFRPISIPSPIKISSREGTHQSHCYNPICTTSQHPKSYVEILGGMQLSFFWYVSTEWI